ncbi:MAG: glycosyltransferase [Thermoleophilia bacterium]|nr:glycosyltransferase [Thermoleophilia bacterium]
MTGDLQSHTQPGGAPDGYPRVVVACGWPRPVGAVVHAGRLARALRAHGLDVGAAAAQPARDAPVEGGVMVVPLAPRDDADPWDTAQAARAALRAAAPLFGERDVGHAEDPVAAAALLDLRDAGALRAVVTTVHHVSTNDRGELEDLQRHAVQGSDLVVCASRHWAGIVAREYGVAPRIVPHGVELARFARQLDDRRSAGAAFGWGARPTVLTLGGIQPRKGSRVMLEAFARARARVGEAALLVVAGPAKVPEFRARWVEDADRLGLRVQRGGAPAPDVDVLELGGVPAAAMPRLMRACDVLASPSTREGFGLAAIEAAATGIPTVLSDIPVFLEHFAHGESCLTVGVGDTRSLSSALVRVFNDEDLRGTLVEGGRRLAARFDWARCADAHLLLYREAMG